MTRDDSDLADQPNPCCWWAHVPADPAEPPLYGGELLHFASYEAAVVAHGEQLREYAEDRGIDLAEAAGEVPAGYSQCDHPCTIYQCADCGTRIHTQPGDPVQCFAGGCDAPLLPVDAAIGG